MINEHIKVAGVCEGQLQKNKIDLHRKPSKIKQF